MPACTSASVVSWADGFAQYRPRNFTPGRFLVYADETPPQRFVFHADAVAVPSKRQTRYADARAHPAGRTPSGCWDDVPTLCGTFAERGVGRDAASRSPLVERPVLACTDAGDLVLDPFGGEGTAAGRCGAPRPAVRAGRAGRGEGETGGGAPCGGGVLTRPVAARVLTHEA